MLDFLKELEIGLHVKREVGVGGTRENEWSTFLS